MFTYYILLVLPVSYSFFFFIYFHGLTFCCIAQNSKKLVGIPRLLNNYAIQYSYVVRCNENNKKYYFETARSIRNSVIARVCSTVFHFNKNM